MNVFGAEIILHGNGGSIQNAKGFAMFVSLNRFLGLMESFRWSYPNESVQLFEVAGMSKRLFSNREWFECSAPVAF